jgi:hypothetical protein
MDTTSHPNWVVMIAIAVVLIVALIAWALFEQRRKARVSEGLRQRFGVEYERLVREMGRRRAEAELRAREQRVDRLTILPLSAQDAARFTDAWRALQARFVDNPKGVVMQADQLVNELMAKRGYPMGDFEQRAGDISVSYPHVVTNYRAARAIAVRADRGEADTEDLRRAVVHYRALFDELLEVQLPAAAQSGTRQTLSVQP